MDELMNYLCIDFRKLLIIKAKKLNISDEECHVLMIIMTLNEIGIHGINPKVILDYTHYSHSKVDEIMVSLVDKKLLGRNKGMLEMKPLYKLLLDKTPDNSKDNIDLISVFEEAFGRCFSSVEVNIINSFKSQGYDDDMIIDALNESVKAGVINFRYIEKILLNWSKYGKIQKYAPIRVEKDDGFSDDVKSFEWWK